MSDYISLGPTPCDEQCTQVGADNYSEMSSKECAAYIRQLRRIHGPEPQGARLIRKSFPHDFGSYHEVCIVYEELNDTARAYASMLEAALPAHWDARARIDLGLPAEVYLVVMNAGSFNRFLGPFPDGDTAETYANDKGFRQYYTVSPEKP